VKINELFEGNKREIGWIKQRTEFNGYKLYAINPYSNKLEPAPVEKDYPLSMDSANGLIDVEYVGITTDGKKVIGRIKRKLQEIDPIKLWCKIFKADVKPSGAGWEKPKTEFNGFKLYTKNSAGNRFNISPVEEYAILTTEDGDEVKFVDIAADGKTVKVLTRDKRPFGLELDPKTLKSKILKANVKPSNSINEGYSNSNITIQIDLVDDDGSINELIKKYKNITFSKPRTSANGPIYNSEIDITGTKINLKAFLTSKDYGLDENDIKENYPELAD
jgi:hypothetical protein